MPSCKQCSSAFEITKDDLVFYDTVSPVFNGKKEAIPPPVFCPTCRFQRRLAFRNDLNLYHRKSDLTGKQIVSMYAPDKPYKVYDQEEFWSDRWDELAYGRPYDFDRTFSEQFKELGLAVPHQSLFTTNEQNSYYTNHSLNCRDCYLVAGITNAENCLYGRFVIDSKDTVDGLSLYSCQWCYEGVTSQNCYQCFFFMNCRNCADCLMVEDCQSCKSCCLCFGLQNKEYHFLNQPLSKEEYEQHLTELRPLTTEKIRILRQKFAELKRPLPHRASHTFGSEDCTGDMIFNSKNCQYTFDCTGCEDCKYLWNTPKGKYSQDGNYTAPDGIEFSYNVGSTVGGQRTMGTFLCWYGSDNYYSREIHHCQNVFGCISMRRKKYCILNKQYTKEEYERLVPKIIEQMRKTGEWGDYLRPSLSYMGYNETLAQENFPLTETEARKQGWNWYVESQEKKESYKGPDIDVPAAIGDVPDDICTKILRCEETDRPFKIIPQELKFYRQMGIPIPKRCPDQRHADRLALRTPRRLWNRTCGKCGKQIATSYAPERPEIVYCEDCYLKQVS
jgi:hypothetical protein